MAFMLDGISFDAGNSDRLLQLLAGVVGLSFSVASATADTRSFQAQGGLNLEASVIAEGLENPWGIEELPNGMLLVTERPGRMRIISAEGKMSGPVAGLPEVADRGQGGLLDVVLDPSFSENSIIYWTYAEPGRGGAGTSAARGRLVDWQTTASPRLEEVEVIFRMAPKSSGGRHFGSRIVPHPDGTFFITTGDRGDPPRAQDPQDHAGSVIRLNKDGSIPADNPFVDEPSVLPEIWSTGHRNIQGADVDLATGLLWTVEHGARGGDEINQPQPMLNYGWPVISYGQHYSGGKIGVGQKADGYEQPLYYWDPSIAPSGLAVYDGDLFASWQGDVLVGALKYQMLVRLDRNETGQIIGEERLLEGAYGRVRDVEVASDGAILLITDDQDGQIIRLSPAN